MSFQTYRDALTAQQLDQLRAATVFSDGLAVPVGALHAAGRALGVGDPEACLGRLIGLGLVDDWSAVLSTGSAHAAVNTLVRPLAGAPLSESEIPALAREAIDAITDAWQDGDGNFPVDVRGVEAARLALAGDATADLLDRTAYAAGTYLFRREHDARGALELLRTALAKIDGLGGSPRAQFLRLASDCAERVGENELHIALLERALSSSSADPIELALVAAQHAAATIARDGPERALATLSEAAAVLQEAGDVRSRAVTIGKIADILQQRGDTDEALRIHVEERLPVAQRIQDLNSIAHVRLRCAQIRIRRGGLQHGEGQLIHDELAESFALLQRLQSVEGIAIAGALLGHVLAAAGARGDATAVLDVSAAAFDRIGHSEQAAEIRALAVSISEES